ncbi:hypothetical protein PQI07_27235 [Methylobacterium sp. 092160098-2]|uniref:hypothetical protein n=1 Tax=Methylobacterium sp. 092160098-2 TaxID=3025129 RepID=UPI002381CDDE|nr:hypothetical protein [Methylobacterium sp. 092160098-2]MDE4914369.1 hypothetical protein [Methylobacterium sp. 092160098-2]
MTDEVIPSILADNLRRIARGDIRFVPDREGMMDDGPGFVCFEVMLDRAGIVRLSAALDPQGPTVVDFNPPGGPWGTEIEMAGGIVSATVASRRIGRLPESVAVDGTRLVDLLSSLRVAAVTAGRHPFVFGPGVEGLDAAA